MRIDQISVELRPRSSWEAAELGTALVRRHARAIWGAWFAVTLPVLCVVWGVCTWLDIVPWAGAFLWFFKPVFDRIPLFVLSRAVFGEAPTIRQTIAAQGTWGWRWMLHYLTWRRLGPYRSLYLPVDLLEGGKDKHKRRNVIGGSARGVAAWLTIVFANFELAFFFGMVMLVPMFTPFESWTGLMDSLGDQITWNRAWIDYAIAAVGYVGMSALEPFYVGAGFGLYLNRRTQLEAWDVEIAFRRLRARLGTAAMALCVAIGLAFAPTHDARAAAPEPAQTPSLRDAMGDRFVDARGFDKAVASTEGDQNLHPVERKTMWVPREFDKEKDRNKQANPIAIAIANAIAKIIKYFGWIVLGVFVLLLVVKFRTWWPWVSGSIPRRNPDAPPIDMAPTLGDEALPDDIVASARALWSQGRARRALALVYRASVETMVARTGALLVPGATESECLRASRALQRVEDRDAFARVVRTWQYAAYADRVPGGDEFEALLSLASERFGWAA